MKKYLVVLLAAALTLALWGCGRPQYEADTFYAAQMLDAYDLAGLPVPKLENSRLNGEYLYCNLTQEEYRVYVAEVIDYLQAREDAQHLCYLYRTNMMFGAFPEHIYVPLTEDCDLSGSYTFAYVTGQTLEYNAPLRSIRVRVARESGTLKRTNFSYNTCIQIDNDAFGTVYPCAAKHTYDAGTVYPIPGYNRQVTICHCIYCNDETRDIYPNFDYSADHTVTLAQGKQYVFGTNQNYLPWGVSSLRAGQVLEIICRVPAEGALQMLVNGEEIPLLRTAEDKATFGFIMPETDVTIEIQRIDES